MSITAMKQALEALESCDWNHGYNGDNQYFDDDKVDNAITSLRQAIAEADRATELLERCENEMRYAGWTKYEADNFARNGVYEQVKQYLEKNT